MRSGQPIAGLGVFGAEGLGEAVAMVAGTPCAVEHGVAEVWPLEA